MTSAWVDFLRAVDITPPEDKILQAAEQILVDAGLTDPSLADGTQPGDIEALSPTSPVDAPVKAFVRRTLRCLDVSAQVAMNKKVGATSTGSPAPSAPAPAPPSSTLALLGGDASALATVRALSGATSTLDISKALKDKGLVVPEIGLADSELFQLLHGALSKDGKSVTYIDLTQKAILPLWLSPESIGGKTVMAGEEMDLDPTSAIGTLGQFQNALKAATASPRWFRRIGQWAPTFIKYGIAGVAVSYTHLTLPTRG